MTNHTITTVTGHVVDPFNINPKDVCLEDVAHALSMQCRFNGHVNTFYSVAEHSVLVSRLCRQRAEDLGWTGLRAAYVRMAGLLHDCGEAYLGDIVTPVKDRLMALSPNGMRVNKLVSLAEIDAYVTNTVVNGLLGEPPNPLHAAITAEVDACDVWDVVHWADKKAFQLECDMLRGPTINGDALDEFRLAMFDRVAFKCEPGLDPGTASTVFRYMFDLGMERMRVCLDCPVQYADIHNDPAVRLGGGL